MHHCMQQRKTPMASLTNRNLDPAVKERLRVRITNLIVSPSPELARPASPRRCGMGPWPAAAPIAGDKWDSGLELLRETSPAPYNKMENLYSTCG